jgi:hypothetical protein
MKGPKHFRNEAFGLVNEFFQRKALAKLGFHGGSTGEVSWLKAQRLMEVGNEVEKCRSEDLKARSRKRG